MIEQKSLGIPLDKKIKQSDGVELTPYEQAKRYDNELNVDEKAYWIITSNFSEIWIYNMHNRIPEPIKLNISELETNYYHLNILINQETKKISHEVKVSKEAGELVAFLYDSLLALYDDPTNPDTLKDLNQLCVRLVFCLYAEDACIFGEKGKFHDYMAQYNASNASLALKHLFEILNQKEEDRYEYLSTDNPMLDSFPWVNGGLFKNEIEIPEFTDEMMKLLLVKASEEFDWSEISPTIFGAVFESTLNPETRKKKGMHYTSIENIHKVIDPLFLDKLKAEFNEIASIKTRTLE